MTQGNEDDHATPQRRIGTSHTPHRRIIELTKTARMGIEQETSDEPHRFNETPIPIPTTKRSETPGER